MYSRMVLMLVCWRYGMPFDANGCVSTLVNIDWVKECVFASSLRLALMIEYFLEMNIKRCTKTIFFLISHGPWDELGEMEKQNRKNKHPPQKKSPKPPKKPNLPSSNTCE